MKEANRWRKILGFQVGDYVKFKDMRFCKWVKEKWYYGTIVLSLPTDCDDKIRYRIDCDLASEWPIVEGDLIRLVKKKENRKP
jgi:hypothetical protein